MRRVTLVWALALVWAFSLVWVAKAAAPGLVVKGDAAAWKEIQEAQARLRQLKSYQMKARIEDGGSILMEYVNPDRSRTVIEMPGFKNESITVGGEHRFRFNGGPWQCADPAPSAPGVSDGLPEGQAEVTAERGPKVKIDGEETQMYRYWFGSRDMGVFRLYVLTKSGLPRRLDVLDEEDNVTMSMDYTGFNAPIVIELPKC